MGLAAGLSIFPQFPEASKSLTPTIDGVDSLIGPGESLWVVSPPICSLKLK
jgi:hypothetical protein